MDSFTNRRGQTTYCGYDSILGKLASITSPEATLTFVPDTWGRVSQISQPATATTTGGTHAIAQDPLGRVTSINGPWSDDTISYFYDNATRSVTRTSPGGMTQTTAANAAGQTASVANILGTFTNNYDGLGGPLTSITHTGANAGFNTAFTCHGDAFDRVLASITSTKPGGATVGKHSYTYDAVGNIASWKREAPLVNSTPPTRQFESKVYYDPAHQVTSVIHAPLAGSSVVESAQHYVYDAAGNIASRQVESPGAASTMIPYSHNSLNQITSLGGSSGARPMTVRGSTSELAKVKAKTGIATDWKSARMLEGNRFEADLDLATGANQINLQAKDGSGNRSDYAYSLSIAAAAAAAPTYDADGNMTSDGSRTFEWDSQSRLTKITTTTGGYKTTEFKYNALGQRSTRIETSQPSGYPVPVSTSYHHLYDGIHLLDRRAGNSNPNSSTIDRRYLSQGEQRYNGATWENYYYTRDHLGSIREVVKSDGALAARYDYEPYGKRSTQYQSSTYLGGCDLGFTGHITLPSAVSGQTELVLTCFRAYAPEFGRWLSADPVGEKGGVNLYGYVENSPIIQFDQLGLEIVLGYGGGTSIFGYGGMGFHAEIMPGLAFDEKDPLNSKFVCSVQFAPLLKTIGKYVGAGVQGGVTYNFSPTPAGGSGGLSLHQELDAGNGPESFGLSSDLGFSRTGKKLSITGVSVCKGRVGPGKGAGAALGIGINGTGATPSIRDALNWIKSFF